MANQKYPRPTKLIAVLNKKHLRNMEIKTMTDNRETLAAALYAAFITKTRDNGETFYCLSDNSPEWMREAMQDAHSDFLPDDYKYRMIHECAAALTDYEPDSWEDSLHEIADGLVDVYTSDLTAWLASDVRRVGYCEEAATEYGLTISDADFAKRIMLGQYAEYMEILSALVSAIESESETLKD
jgi:hypothetical protein